MAKGAIFIASGRVPKTNITFFIFILLGCKVTIFFLKRACYGLKMAIKVEKTVKKEHIICRNRKNKLFLQKPKTMT
jgi:hypothetical protein